MAEKKKSLSHMSLFIDGCETDGCRWAYDTGSSCYILADGSIHNWYFRDAQFELALVKHDLMMHKEFYMRWKDEKIEELKRTIRVLAEQLAECNKEKEGE